MSNVDLSVIIKYFSLTEHPFLTSPDPRFLYFSSQVKEALAKSEFMARDRIGPIYMYGPIGSGKTSLVRRLQEKFSQDERYNVKLLISPNLKSSNAFLRLILETFDVKTERSYAASLNNFEQFLYQFHAMLPYMGKAAVGMGGKHGRKTGRHSVASGGYPRGSAGTISEARER